MHASDLHTVVAGKESYLTSDPHLLLRVTSTAAAMVLQRNDFFKVRWHPVSWNELMLLQFVELYTRASVDSPYKSQGWPDNESCHFRLQ